ncbi:DNA-binding transcriptional LysR family regulator [Agrobacterium pusense]|nr:DNA-binding transcriptional LysR family regulator [Agrobacterium pusense]
MCLEMDIAREEMLPTGELRGRLRVAAPSSFGPGHFAPALAELARQHPLLQLHAHYSDRYVDLVAEGFDCGIRVGYLQDSNLTARKIGAFAAGLFASPECLRIHGVPQKPSDLFEHQAILQGTESWKVSDGTKTVVCTEGVKRAEMLIRPGALMRDVNNAAFEPMIERGMLASPEARTMPYNWAPMDDGGARLIPRQYVKNIDWEAQGRSLMHVYPATHGPHNPNLGHSVGMAGGQNSFNISSHNYDRMEEGMVFVLHAQWLEPLSAGCNVGDMYVVTKDGFENLSRHTPLETHRIAAEA